MQALKAKMNKGLQHGSFLDVCDNSGAKLIKLISVVTGKGVAGRSIRGGVSDLILASVRKGKPEMRKQVVYAIIVRQKKEYRRPDGMRVKFEDNAAVVLKDEKGNPKGTLLKGPIAKEIAERWPMVAKIATVVI